MLTNLYILLVAPKGSGKTPASKCFLGPLLELEQEDIRVFNENNSKKKKKKKVGQKRKIFDEFYADNEDLEGMDQGDVREESEEEGPLASLFHKKTRICETVTSEALLETLRHNSGCLLLKTDEFKV